MDYTWCGVLIWIMLVPRHPRITWEEIVQVPQHDRVMAPQNWMSIVLFKVPKNFLTFIGFFFHVWGSLVFILTYFLFPPWNYHMKMSFKRRIFCLRFPRYLLIVNGNKTIEIPYPLVKCFQWAILLVILLRNEKLTLFPRKLY